MNNDPMEQSRRTIVSGFDALVRLPVWIGAGIVADHTAFYSTRLGRAELPILPDDRQPSRARIASNNLWGLPARLFGAGAILLIAFFFRPGRPVGALGIKRDRFGR